MTHPALTVVATASNFSRARRLMLSIRSALGSGPAITIRLPQSEISDLSAASWSSPRVSLYPLTSPAEEILDSLDSEVVLVMPAIDAIAVSGIGVALDFLAEHPGVTEVGGLIRGPGNAVESGAFRVIHEDDSEGLAIAPLETCEPVWHKAGEFAATSADFVGGVVLVRQHVISAHHLGDGHLVGRALSPGRPNPEASRLVFSGLQAFSARSTLAAFPPSGECEDLSPEAFEAWRETGLRQITVLHRGVALRNDLGQRVTFHPDWRITAVDGRGARVPAASSGYYAQTRNRIQLGPGFSLSDIALIDEGLSEGTFDNFRGSIEGLTQYERFVISLIRRVAGKLPSFAMTFAKKVMARMSKMV